MIEVNFAAHQPMQPFGAHGKALAEQIDVAGLIGATNEDDVPAQRRMRVKFEVPRHRSAPWGRFGKRLRSRAVRCDVSVRTRLQFCDACHVVTLPHFCLPQAVEALDGVLHTMLERGHKYGDHFELQAHAADATYDMGMVVRSLKHVVVVELRVRGTAIVLPAREQQRHSAFGAPLRCPSISQRAMQTLGGEHIDQWPVGELEIRDEVKAVELGLPRYYARQIPALGWRGAPDTPYTVLQSETRKRAVNAGFRRCISRPLGMQRHLDRSRPILAQDTLTQLDAKCGNALLNIERRTVPGATRLVIREIHTVQATSFGTSNPERHGAHVHTKLSRYSAHTLTRAHQANHLTALLIARF